MLPLLFSLYFRLFRLTPLIIFASMIFFRLRRRFLRFHADAAADALRLADAAYAAAAADAHADTLTRMPFFAA